MDEKTLLYMTIGTCLASLLIIGYYLRVIIHRSRLTVINQHDLADMLHNINKDIKTAGLATCKLGREMEGYDVGALAKKVDAHRMALDVRLKMIERAIQKTT